MAPAPSPLQRPVISAARIFAADAAAFMPRPAAKHVNARSAQDEPRRTNYFASSVDNSTVDLVLRGSITGSVQ